ncbi:2-amino-4-hydroxy-6-hydroxymethyldihydropteridine diphosphokinase [uncultured Paraglaciecola sp.]|uniref:2-amino-4-hydroxy-6- hydroxymethyldihydropteridine diphosphokinase n=1 Tax=uncultured Paraglaciecola sp. TaxID=1765024 RepID=UPI0026171C7B|nr:2-amino-4-hydroxy-6-hydroxymethyldihydropteridine diphosphokinase [uncultured Paraglaciecola sp.]
MIDVYIGLGSNLTLPEKQIQAAYASLARLPDTVLIKCSSLYKSQPMGPQDQPDYVNAVALIETALSPESLLQHTQLIENQQGRIRKASRWGPRTLDLDMLLFGLQRIDNEHLTVPHSGMKQREFVLYPLFEIAPDLILPCGEKLANLVMTCPINGLQKMTNSVLI